MIHVSMPKAKLQCSQNAAYGILLAEPHPLVAHAITKLLAPITTLNFLGSVDNGLQVLSYFRKLQPQIVILDSEISGMGSLDLIRQLKKRQPDVKILIYTVQKDSQHFHQFLKNGAQGLVLKTQPAKNLIDAIISLIHKKIYIDPALNTSSFSMRTINAASFGLPSLSPRERQILKLIAEGLKNKEISNTFSISVKTVESHRSNIMRKLDAHHIVDLLNWARRYEMVSA